MIYERAMELVRTLESGKFEQGKDRLAQDNKFCCLGVACVLVPGISTTVHIDRNAEKAVITLRFDGNGGMLPQRAKEYFGFYDAMGARRDDDPLDFGEHGDYKSLAAANDNGVPFEAIAKYIRENWEHL